MAALKMIDTIGSGIRRMYIEQRKRFLPAAGLPDRRGAATGGGAANWAHPGRARTAQVLMQQPDVVVDGRVRAGPRCRSACHFNPAEAKALRGRKLIEGRAPNLHVSAQVAEALGEPGAVHVDQGPGFGLLPGTGVSAFAQLQGLLARRPGTGVDGKAAGRVDSHAQKRNRVTNLLAR